GNRKGTDTTQEVKTPSGKPFPTRQPDFGQEGQTTGSSISTPPSGTPPVQMQKEIKKIEENITNKLVKTFSRELEKQCMSFSLLLIQKILLIQRQETILKMVSQSLSTNTTKLLESTIRSEIQNSVLPALSKMVTNAVDKHAHRGISDAVNKSIPAAIEKYIAENIQRVLSKTSVTESIAKGVSKSIRPIIEETFRENFTTVLIPSYQKATNAMFEQITATFEAGIQDIAVKSAQASSYTTNIANVDKTALARLQASVELLTQQLHHLQANITRQGGQQLEQPISRTSDEYPFEKFLFNEHFSFLKNTFNIILNANQQSSVSQPEPYGYLQSGRVPSSQQQSQQQQHPQQLFSPVEPENSDRSLESGNYEDAFVSVLASHDLAQILRLCHKINPKIVFLPSRSLLSQPVILSIIHHLSLELDKYSDLKLAWIEEAILKLNPKDHIIREHCERLLPMVKQRLEHYYYTVAAQDPASPSLKNITLLIHVINGLLI
ncbi:11103_t:CDS:2, partial [Acaulospora morrowiae]